MARALLAVTVRRAADSVDTWGDLSPSSRQYSRNRVGLAQDGVKVVSAGLYIVATPIGNLGDMTQRAVDTLMAVDVIAAEDTRHSVRLLQHFDIRTPLVSYHDHSDVMVLESLLTRLGNGEKIALISDAGTPLVSDPGYRLVVACQDAGFPVVPIPGASATIAALSAAGLPTDHFYFEGFLPTKAGQRRRRLQDLRTMEATLVFFESPRRLPESLEMMCAELGDRQAALCRELTKSFETIRRDGLSGLAEFVGSDPNQQKGESVVLVAGFDPSESEVPPEAWAWLERLADELPPRRAAAVVSDMTGVPSKLLYQWLLNQKTDS